MSWINKFGMAIEFVSFWLAAPEILGEERIRWIENLIENLLTRFTKLKTVLFILFAMSFISWCSMSGYLTKQGYPVRIIPKSEYGNPLFIILIISSIVSFISLSAVYTIEYAIPPVLRILANDQRIRRRSLFIGAFLYTLAFLLQIFSA